MQIQKSFIDSKPTLYIIPTPIGNLDDMTYRSVKVLNQLDYLFCEDTRVTQKLLNHFEVNIKTYTYHEHNKEKACSHVLDLLASGNDCGLVSDAGMPGISDPGYDIISACDKHDYNVVILPGASAFIVAIVRSHMASKQFTYFGFLNKQTTKREEELTHILATDHPTVIYESPHKLVRTLRLIEALDNETEVMVAREITKKFEEYSQGKITDVADYYDTSGVKGECVIVISPNKKCDEITDPIAVYTKLVSEDAFTKKDAIKKVAKQMGVNKNIVYQMVLESESGE